MAAKGTHVDELTVGGNMHTGGDASVAGNVMVGHNLVVEGWLDARNIKGPDKGMFKDERTLKSMIPFPRNGWRALVGTKLPADLYLVEGFHWFKTGEKSGDPKIDLTPYVAKHELHRTTGNDENLPMSQAAVTSELHTMENKKADQTEVTNLSTTVSTNKQQTDEKLASLSNNKVNENLGRNIFDESLLIRGLYVNSYGIVNDGNDNYSSYRNYIKVSASEKYILTKDDREGNRVPVSSSTTYIALYDSQYNFIKAFPANQKIFETTANTKYCRFTVLYGTHPLKVMLAKEADGEEYEQYSPIFGYIANIRPGDITKEKLADSSVSTEKIQNEAVADIKLSSRSALVNTLSNPFYWEKGYLGGSEKRLTSRYFMQVDETFKTGRVTIKPNESVQRVQVFIVAYDENLEELYRYGNNMADVIQSYPKAVWFKFTINGINGVADNIENIELVKLLDFHTSVRFYNELLNNSVSTEKIQNEAVTESKIKDNSVTGNKIANDTVTLDNVAFASSINLVNLTDAEIAIGKYLGKFGQLNDNVIYNTTGYIEIKENANYVIGNTSFTTKPARFVLFYDKDKQPLNSGLFENVKEIESLTGSKYARITFYADDWDAEKVQFTEAPLKPYYPYRRVINKDVLPNEERAINEDIFFLPKDIYVAEDSTIELYYNQIMLNAERYNISAFCKIGIPLKRKFQIKGNSSIIGDYTLTITVYDDNNVQLYKGVSTIHIVPKYAGVELKGVPVGDSLVNEKPWLQQVTNNSGNLIQFVGTRGNKHEGRSGVAASYYNDKTGTAKYTFDNNYTGVGYNAEPFDASKSYSVGNYVKKDLVTYVFINSHTGAWNDTDVFNLSQTNPFYDYKTKSWSISAYKVRNNLNFDFILLFLGTNGINFTPETNPNGALGIKDIIDKIRKEMPDIPIVVVNTIFRSNQNGIGRQGNTDGYKSATENKFHADMKVLLLAKALEKMLRNYPNVYLCPVGFTHDSAYNFGLVKTKVNPYIETTDVYELYPSDSIHPQNSGYMQFADEIYSILCYIFNKKLK